MTERICAARGPGGNRNRITLLLLGAFWLAGVAVAQQPVTVSMQTSMGEVRVALDAQRAPLTVDNFLKYVDAKRFDNITFYRAVKLDAEGKYGMVQGGLKGDTRKLFKPVAHEAPAATGILHLDGSISMARMDPGTATADFFFVIGDLPPLDGKADGTDPGYAAFGRVSQGMEIIRQVLDLPRSEDAGDGSMKGQMLAEPVKIFSVRRVD